MTLGSVPTTTIDINFIRAQGVAAQGWIKFKPVRQKVGDNMLSTVAVRAFVVNGIGSISLVRLPYGAYKVSEEIDGQTPYEFSFALPINAPDLIAYEDIAPVSSIPSTYTSVKTINGVAPNPTTGNIVVDTAEAQQVPDATSSVKGLIKLTGDLAGTSDSPQLSSTLLGKIDEKYVKPGSGIPAGDLTSAVQALLGLAGTAVQPAGLDALISAIAARSLPDRLIMITDTSRTAGGVNTYNMPNTGQVWTLFTDGPAEYIIPAAAGDHIQVPYSMLIGDAGTTFVDLVTVTGATPTRQTYLSTRSSTPSFSGPSGNYPSDTGLRGRSGVLDFIAGSNDIDGGLVRLRWAIKTNSSNGKIYANDNYPLVLSIRNTRLSGL